MAMEERELAIPLNGGIDEVSLGEFVEPPALQQSLNTRLSVIHGTVTKCPKETLVLEMDEESSAKGLVPCGNADSTILYRDNEQLRISRGFVESVTSTKNAGGIQNTYVPAQLTHAGGIFSSYVNAPPAVLDWRGYTFYAAAVPQADTGLFGIYVTVYDGDGSIDDEPRVIVPQTLVQQTDIADGQLIMCFVGLTRHSANGVYVWYAMDDNSIYYRKLTVSDSDNSLTIGTEFPFFQPFNKEMIVVCSGGGEHGEGHADYAWAVTASATSSADVTVHRIEMEVLPHAMYTTIASAVPLGPMKVAAAEYLENGESYFNVTFSTVQRQARFVLDGLTPIVPFTTRWSVTDVVALTGVSNLCASGFVTHEGTLKAISMYSPQPSLRAPSDPLAQNTGIRFKVADAATGLNVSGNIEPFTRLATRCHTNVLGLLTASQRAVPYFVLTQAYESSGEVLDPALHLCTLRVEGNSTRTVPVARFGVDESSTYEQWTFPTSDSISVRPNTDKIAVAYGRSRNPRGLAFAEGSKYTSKRVRVDRSTPWQPRFAIDDAGVTTIAAAHPAYWDGQETVEIGPAHLPVIAGESTGGTGDDWNGVFGVRAMAVFRDSAGQLHRSAASLPITISASPDKPVLYVGRPFTLRSGWDQELVDIEIYVTADGSSSPYYRQPFEPSSVDYVTGLFSFEDTPAPTTNGPALALSGVGELLPQMPGALHDACIVGKRMWAIDAEDRSLVWPSKTKAKDIAHEFAGELKIRFPASAGKLTAVSELDGNPVFFTETGVYAIYGEGPNNAGQGARFSEPRRLSDLPCTERQSVLKCPAGILFSTGATMAILTTGGAVQVTKTVPYGTGFTTGAFITREREAALFSGNGEALTLDIDSSNFSKWDYVAAAVQSTSGCFEPTNGRVLLAGANTIHEIDPTQASTTAQMSVRTGWLQPGGQQGDVTIRGVIFQGAYGGQHDVTITVEADYDSALTTARTWTNAELVPLVNGQQRYTLFVDHQWKDVRSVRITVAETNAAGTACVPISATVLYGIDPKVKQRALRDGAKK